MLLRTLVYRQGGLSDREFAARLGMSLDAWEMVKEGRKPISRQAVDGILTAYPDLHASVMNYIASYGRRQVWDIDGQSEEDRGR